MGMMGSRWQVFALMLTLLIVAGCAPASNPTAPSASSEEAAQPAGRTRLTVAIQSDPPTLSDALNPANVRGADELEVLVNVGLAVVDNHGGLVTRLADGS